MREEQNNLKGLYSLRFQLDTCASGHRHTLKQLCFYLQCRDWLLSSLRYFPFQSPTRRLRLFAEVLRISPHCSFLCRTFLLCTESSPFIPKSAISFFHFLSFPWCSVSSYAILLFLSTNIRGRSLATLICNGDITLTFPETKLLFLLYNFIHSLI